MQQKNKAILILMHSWVGFIHGVQKGLSQFFAEHPEWMATHHSPFPAQVARLGKDHYDGVIAFADHPYYRQLQRLKTPVVNIANGIANIGLPAVFVDDAAVGRMAAQYLKDLGLRHFACLGSIDYVYARQRRRAFIDTLTGMNIHVHQASVSAGWTAVLSLPGGPEAEVLDWLRNLPKPIAIFGTSDAAASELLQLCRIAGIAVPQDVCVLGVDNDEYIATMSYPPLSSIELPTESIGYTAAQLLEKLMAGEAPPKEPILLQPVRVVSRQSTNVLAIPDADVVAAVRHIRDYVHESVTVSDLLRIVPLNRRYFERKFKRHLGRTPLQEILRVRVDRAKELLATTDLSMPAVARRSGFPTAEQLAIVFRRSTGTTPTLYRRSHQLRD